MNARDRAIELIWGKLMQFSELSKITPGIEGHTSSILNEGLLVLLTPILENLDNEQEKAKGLIEALEFYANEKHWNGPFLTVQDMDILPNGGFGANGWRARVALRKYRGGP